MWGFFFPTASFKELIEKPLWVELHQVVVTLANPCKDDGAAGGESDGESRAAFGIGVHLGEDRSVKSHDVLEHLCLFNGIVASQRVAHKEGEVRVGDLSDFVEFVHQIGLVLHPTSGVNEDNIDAFGFGRIDGISSDGC